MYNSNWRRNNKFGEAMKIVGVGRERGRVDKDAGLLYEVLNNIKLLLFKLFFNIIFYVLGI